MKFKVGDKVRVKKGLEPGRLYGAITLQERMMDAEGIVERADSDHTYRMKGNFFWYSEEMLELAGVEIERRDILNAMTRIIHDDESTAEMVKGLPLMVPVLLIVAKKLEDEFFGEEQDDE